MSLTVTVRFYAELNDYLPEERRFKDSALTLPDPLSIRHLIDACGVPASAVDLVLVNGASAGLERMLRDGDRVSIYPVFESLDIRQDTEVRAIPLRRARFVLDVHLGKLTSHLRMLGFDSLYRNDAIDAELVRISVDEERTLLSKDRALVATAILTRSFLVTCSDPREQLKEVLKRFDLWTSISPFVRCMVCNALLEGVDKERALPRLPPRVAASFEEFRMCPDCKRIYWKGSHYQRMESFIRTLADSSPS